MRMLILLVAVWGALSGTSARAQPYSIAKAVSSDAGKVALIVLRSEAGGVEAAIAPEKGGELSSLRVRRRGKWVEMLYLGRDYSPRDDWTGKAPFLWPATGRNFPPELEKRRQAGEVFHDGAWTWKGKRYPMAIHGFARDFPWQAVEKGADGRRARAVLSFGDNERTRKMYPFGFHNTVEYRLSGRTLEIRYTIWAAESNQDAMPFSLGNHITFNVPLAEGSEAGKMLLLTSSGEELLKTYYGLPTGEVRPRSHAYGVVLRNFERRRAVSLTRYRGDPLVLLQDPGGIEVRLSHSATRLPPQPVVLFNLWGDAEAGFFSPEPWVGLQNSLVLDKGLIYLAPGEKFEWTIVVKVSVGE